MASHGFYAAGHLYPKQSSLYTTGLRTKLRRRTRWALTNVKAIYDLGHESDQEAHPIALRSPSPEVLNPFQSHKHTTPKPDSLRHHRKRLSKIRKQIVTVSPSVKPTDQVSPPIVLPQPCEQLKLVDPFDPDTQIYDSNKRASVSKKNYTAHTCHHRQVVRYGPHVNRGS